MKICMGCKRKETGGVGDNEWAEVSLSIRHLQTGIEMAGPLVKLVCGPLCLGAALRELVAGAAHVDANARPEAKA